MNRKLDDLVRRRADQCCEYCLIHQSSFSLRFQIDHILAEKHGGETVEDNLALACTHCNRHKGPNIAGIDPETSKLIRLFNPRKDKWKSHFFFKGLRLKGKTAVGRTR